jgi:hypothetical protein
VTVNIERLPPKVRPIMTLCPELSPSRLGHQSKVFDYLVVGETALAIELLIAGSEPELRPEERGLIATHLGDVYIDLWVEPGASAAWVDQRCEARMHPPGQ